MSRGWNGGDAELVVDEGYGIHMQDINETHVGRVLIEHNLSVFNGKSGIGLFGVEDATVSNNNSYMNGLTTGNGSGSGMNLQATRDTIVTNNLLHAQSTHNAFYTLAGATYTTSNNWMVAGNDNTG